MTNDTEPIPELQPAPAQPAPAQPATSQPTPAQPAPAQPAAASQPVASQPVAAQPAPPSRRRKILGMTAQTAGVVGIVVCLAMVVALVFARGWAVDRVDSVASRIDDGLAKGVPLLDRASNRVAEVTGRIGAVADAAEARAAQGGNAPQLVEAVRGAVSKVSDRYLELRNTYAGARESIVSVLDTLTAFDRLVPGIEIPQGPVDTLRSLDERVQSLDAAVSDLLVAGQELGTEGRFAQEIADKAGQLEASMAKVESGLDEAQAQLEAVRTEVANTADTINTAITIGTIVLILAFLYSALLHWVLFRSGGRLRRGA